MSKRELARDVGRVLVAAGNQRALAYRSGWAKTASGAQFGGASGIHPGFRVTPFVGDTHTEAVYVYEESETNPTLLGYVGLVRLKHDRERSLKQMARTLRTAGFATEIVDGRSYRHGDLSVALPLLRVTRSAAVEQGVR